MKKSSSTARIALASVIIVGTIVWLAWSGVKGNESYFVTIAEMHAMGDKAFHSNLRVDGFVKPGSIQQDGPHVTFVMNEFESHSPKAAAGRLLTVVYNGSEPPPDTFKDNAQALAIGTYGRDGVFHATELQAKCASKYAPAQPNGQPGAKPGTQPGSMPAAAPSGNPRAAAATPANPAAPAPAPAPAAAY